jgi:hypothetical protein
MGESPIKWQSKVTPTYASEKKFKVIKTVKRRLQEVMQIEDSEVKFS